MYLFVKVMGQCPLCKWRGKKRGEKGGIGHKKKRRVSQPSQGKARQGKGQSVG